MIASAVLLVHGQLQWRRQTHPSERCSQLLGEECSFRQWSVLHQQSSTATARLLGVDCYAPCCPDVSNESLDRVKL